MTAPVTPEFTESHYVLSELRDSNKSVIGYAFNPVTLDAQKVTTLVTKFNAVDADGEELGDYLYYNPSDYTIYTRLYEIESGSLPKTYKEHKEGVTSRKYTDTLDGYTFKDNTEAEDKLSTTIRIHQDYDKQYKIRLDFEPDGTQISGSDNYYVFVEADHQTTGKAYLLKKIETDGSTPVDISFDDSEWKKEDGQPKPNEKFTGKEELSIKIVRATGDAVTIDEIRQNSKCAVIEEGGSVKGAYKVSS